MTSTIARAVYELPAHLVRPMCQVGVALGYATCAANAGAPADGSVLATLSRWTPMLLWTGLVALIPSTAATWFAATGRHRAAVWTSGTGSAVMFAGWMVFLVAVMIAHFPPMVVLDPMDGGRSGDGLIEPLGGGL